MKFRNMTAGGILAACAALGITCTAPNQPSTGDTAGDSAALRAIAGLELYSQSGCAACHCNDAVGGCTLDAPNIHGVGSAKLNEMLRGTQQANPHPLKTELTDDQIDDLAVFLDSLQAGASLDGDSAVTQGYMLYISGNCILCHLSSAQGVNQGGLGVPIAGTNPDNIFSALSGAVPCHPRQSVVPDEPSAECLYPIESNETVLQLTDTAPPDTDDERVLLSYFLAFIAPPPTAGPPEPCNEVAGDICTIAGTGVSGYTRDGVPARETPLFSPREVALTDWNDDGVLDLVMSDWNNHRIRVVYIDTVIDGVAGRIESIAGTGKVTGSDALNHPTDVAFDADGALVMANWHNQNIYRYARGLQDGADRDQLAGLCDQICSDDAAGVTRVDETFLNLPASIALHPDGRIFIAESGCSRLRVLTIGQTRERVHPAQCIAPINMYTDGMIETVAGSSGVNGYAGDGGPASEAIFRIDNTPISPNFGISLSHQDPPERLYIADSLNHCIRYIDLTVDPPTIHLFAGVPESPGLADGPATEAQFFYPTNVYAHSDGIVYVADTFNHAIRRIDPDSGSVTTIAGNGTRGFNEDNIPATEATLDNPTGVAIHPDGRIFIADLGNNRVRVIQP